MNSNTVIYLLHDVPGVHGVHDKPEPERRKRFAERRSATRSEFYQAGTMGLMPSCVFVLSMAESYDDELRVEWHGKVYNVIRTYENENGGIELTVQREG